MTRPVIMLFVMTIVFSFGHHAVAQLATPDQISSPDGFRVELIYSVPKETEGSWVALTRLRNGQLVASDQGDKGLFLIDINPVRGGPEVMVSRIPVDLSGAQGMVDTEDGLYVNLFGRGMFLLTDSDSNGSLDSSEALTPLAGGGEHGQHALILDKEGKSLFVEAGNHTELPPYVRSRTGGKWDEDLLLPREWDARGHARGILAPGGWITQYDLKTREHTVYSIGYRNSYDVAQNSLGDLFTFDADMEWDMGMPWYRPTRICHAVSGSDFGWRSGTGKWAAYFEDSLPPVVDIGPSSPTGVVLGTEAKFPAKYQRALFALDWTFGIIYAIHLQPEGASYTGDAEIFVSGRLPVTDAVIGADGALYFTTGGRGVDSGLYRVTYNGSESVEPAPELTLDGDVEKAHAARQMLEQFHGVENGAAVDAAWPHLKSTDRFIRHAARVAIESQPADQWKAKVFSESDPQALITAAVALARTGTSGDQPDLLTALDRLEFSGLDRGQQLGLLRAYGLTFIRMGAPMDDAAKALSQKLLSEFPSADADVNTELVRMLVYLKCADVIEPVMNEIRNRQPTEPEAWSDLASRNSQYGGPILKMINNPPPSHEISYALMLRNLRRGWTLEQRRAYLEFLGEAAKAAGGESYTGFLANLRSDFLGNCSNAELAELSDLADVSFRAEPDFEIRPPQGPGRKWTLDEARELVRGENLKTASFENGRSLFYATNCSACHRFAGLGGDVGPDLTSVRNKFDANYILEAMITPSTVISDQYAASKVLLSDGTLVVGIIADGDEGELIVYPSTREAKIEPVIVDANDVEDIAPSELSQMPDGLLDNLNANEVRDLVAYLMSAGDENSGVYGK